jgi:hypothetical protein
MSQKPPLLPNDPALDADTRPGASQSRRGLERWLWVLVLLFLIALGSVASVIIYRPDLLGLATFNNLTATSQQINGTVEVFNRTAQSLSQQNFDVENTRAALENAGQRFIGEQTRIAQNFVATETAIAFANAQQATRAALDFRGTQVAFQQEATRVELNYRGTQAALNRDATAVALGFATQAPSSNNPFTPTPTITQAPLFEDGFSGDRVSSGIWRFGDQADWTINPAGELTAARSGAWLLTQIGDLTDYAFDLTLIPVSGVTADYFLLVTVPESGDGLTLRLSYNGERITAVGVFRFDVMQLLDADGLLGEALTPVTARQIQAAPAETLDLRLSLRDDTLRLDGNGAMLFETTLDTPITPGAVGLQLPDSARVIRTTLLP